MAEFRTIKDVLDEQWRGKRVLVRVDFNVPLAEGRVGDDTRIQAALPTIRYLRERGGKVILVSHLGRPKGETPKLSLKPVAEHLGKLLGASSVAGAGGPDSPAVDIRTARTSPTADAPVRMAPPGVGEDVRALINSLAEGEVLMLENIRFHPEEEQNDKAFALALAGLADVYVNDAFGTAHRAHASTAGVAAHLPSYAGLLMEKELKALGEVLGDPKRPFVAIIGGAKVSSKIAVLEQLIQKVDRLIIGGGMAFTFLKAQGLEVGKSLVEADQLGFAARLLKQAGERILLPLDVFVADSFEADKAHGAVDVQHIPADQLGMDVGPNTVAAVRVALKDAATVLWNGPMGVFEKEAFAYGTFQVAKLLAEATDRGCVTVVGGGDSVAAIEQLGLADRFTHVSTGGGATLEFLEGRELPGVSALAQPAGSPSS